MHADPNVDLAGTAHWDRLWAQQPFPPEIDPHSTSVWAYRDRLLHEAIARSLEGRPRGLRLVELGCARSAWLPYFAREFGCRIAGLDYSEIGAAQTAQRLAEDNLACDVRCADLFRPPPDWLGAFDVVSWFGVAEHFRDTTGVIRAAAALLKPGGLMITEIPNMAGINGWLQRTLNKPVYDIHMPLTAAQLALHHHAAGLSVLTSEYVVPLDFGVVEIDGLPPGRVHRALDAALYALRLLGGVAWWLDRRLGPSRPGPVTGSFILVTAEKRADA